MKLEYNLDLSDTSVSLSATPGDFARRLGFYVYECGMFDAGDGYFTQRSGLDNYIMMYTLSGAGAVELGARAFELSEGRLIFFNCLQPHRYRTAPGGRWKFYFVHFDGQSVAPFDLLINGSGHAALDAEALVAELFCQLLWSVERQDPFSCFRENELMTRMFTSLAGSRFFSAERSALGQHAPDMERVIAFIKDNFERKIALNDLAERAHLSKFHFARLFKEYTNMSPYEYVTGCRINASKKLLRGTELTVNAIASSVGFMDSNTFIRTFKRCAGQSPTEYRRSRERLP